MTTSKITFDRTIGEQCVLEERACWVEGLMQGIDTTLQYYVSSTDANGRPFTRWVRAGDLTDTPAV